MGSINLLSNIRLHPEAVVIGSRYRFTVLSDRLIRYEWAEDGQFEDRSWTFAINRAFEKTDFNVVDKIG